MDPVAAFSLAGTILQFIDSGTKFVTLARRLYQSGSDDTIDHLQSITENLDAILPKLKYTQNGGDSEKTLGQLTLDCGKTATQLLAILRRVNAAGNIRKRDAIKAAFRLTCKESEIKSFQDRLSSFRNQLNLHLLLSIREHVSKSAEQQQAVLQGLGVIRNQTEKVGGISASILGYLVQRGNGPGNYVGEIRSLQSDLVSTLWESGAVGNQFEPRSIPLSQTDRERVQSLFISGLQYDSMIDRESRIATAHESTFQWVFQNSHSHDHQSRTIGWSSLQNWLESDDQLYWITGKAGSGKSTLMKFLCSPTTEESRPDGAKENLIYSISQERFRCHLYLENWAGRSGLVVASFYFWNSGMELQMTQEGLLRTLLYQVLAQRPDIIPTIASKHWESLCLFDCCKDVWTAQELHKMLFRAAQALSNDSKICFFIDGLDEFAASHEDLISLVKELIKGHGHLKICVASRPWNIFQTAFGQKPNLRLEDLTFDDIKKFVQSKFYADTEFENLRRRYPSFANQLMNNIVAKASGVFLWVDLVVASLLAGMRLGDRIEDFQRRLDELPPDLENLYEKILYNLDPFYLKHAAQYFTLVESAEAPLTILQFSFADEESPESAIKMVRGSMSYEERSFRIEAMNRRLNSRCKGFLETDRGLQSIQDNGVRHSSGHTVQYLHRTVRDYIKSPKAQKFLQLSSDPNFDPSNQLCLAYLMDIKTWYSWQDGDHILDQHPEEKLPSFANISHCLRHAAGVAKVNEGVVVELLEELKSVIHQRKYRVALARDFKDRQIHLQSSTKSFAGIFPGHFRPIFNLGRSGTGLLEEATSRMIDDSFLSLAIVHGVVPYARARTEWGGLIQQPSREDPEKRWPLLLDALAGDVPEPKMVECLLGLGADPNFKMSKVDSQTPWITALTKVTLLYTIQNHIGTSAEYLQAEDKWKQTLRLMFLRGADCTKVRDSLLTPISRKILQDLREEVERDQSPPGWAGWLRAWKLA